MPIFSRTPSTATALMLLVAGGILYPEVNAENILIALRVSAFTTAIPFLLVFVAQPLGRIRPQWGQALQKHHRLLWLSLTISHLIHLYQILLYGQLEPQCPLYIWLITIPLWLVTIIVSGVEVVQPQVLDALYTSATKPKWELWYSAGLWYVWLIFSLAFGMSAVANHLPLYNIPAFVLYLAGAILWAIATWRRRLVS